MTSEPTAISPPVIPLNTGIALVAPGGYAPDRAAVERGIQTLRDAGCLVRDFTAMTPPFQRFGATDQQRIDQLYAASAASDVQIVLALRGGYGCSRLLPRLDFQSLAESGKLFVGHSDFTALQMGLLAATGAISFAGPMVNDDFSAEQTSDFTLRHFWNCLTQATTSIQVAAKNNPALDVSGTLWGGNLALLAHLVGTPYLPKIEGGILFIEDVNEHPYRIERMLLQLHYAGVLERQQAIVFGDFSRYQLTAYDNGYDFAAMLEFLRTQIGTPILTGLPFGHMRDKVTLAVGAPAHLISTADGFELSMSGYPTLP